MTRNDNYDEEYEAAVGNPCHNGKWINIENKK